jgi:hypothetical protein
MRSALACERVLPLKSGNASRPWSAEVKELRKANEILKLASAFFAQAELDRRIKS